MPDPAEHSRDTYEVVSGKLHHIDERGERVTLAPGATFHPTLRQVDSGSLENKARKVKAGSPKAGVVVGVDFDDEGNIVREDEATEAGIDAGPAPRSLDGLAWGSKTALKKARNAEPPLTVDEMEAAGATGETGFVTADVNRALEARS